MNIINLLVYLCEMCSTIFMMSSLFLYDVVHPGNHQPLKAGHWLLMWCWRHEWKHRCCYSIRKFCIFLANHSTGSGSFTISSFVCPSSIHFLETNSVSMDWLISLVAFKFSTNSSTKSTSKNYYIMEIRIAYGSL